MSRATPGTVVTSPARSQLLAMLLVMVLLAGSGRPVWGGQAMPYTAEALSQLNQVTARLKPPPAAPVGEGEVKAYVESYRRIFDEAGFDYERSMMKIINDIQFERYRVNAATITLNRLARELLRLHVKNGIDPRKYLGSDCGNLLIEFRNLIRSNMKKYGGC